MSSNPTKTVVSPQQNIAPGQFFFKINYPKTSDRTLHVKKFPSATCCSSVDCPGCSCVVLYTLVASSHTIGGDQVLGRCSATTPAKQFECQDPPTNAHVFIKSHLVPPPPASILLTLLSPSTSLFKHAPLTCSRPPEPALKFGRGNVWGHTELPICEFLGPANHCTHRQLQPLSGGVPCLPLQFKPHCPSLK